ncbi:MAG: SDR family NAD(P)-dependent oxidoreductase [Bacteroidota bacterium]
MTKRRAIVTAAYGAIGKAIAMGMAKQDHQLVLVGRNETKLRDLTNSIMDTTGNPGVSFQTADLSRKTEIESFARQWQGPLHVLINNAATTPRTREETSEGIEMQFATNVLGYFWMIQYFAPFMRDLEDARIVNVASYWAGDLDLNDLEFTRRPYNNDTAYRQTKQADRMLTVAFAQKLAAGGVSVLAAHPGDVNSKLSNNLGYGGWESPEQGAATPLYCATDPSLEGVTGKYFENRKETPCGFARDQQAIDKLWQICSRY